MLELLSKILGPHRAVSVYVFLQRRGVALLCALGFAGVLAILFISSAPEDHEHEAFHTVPVLSITPVGNNDTSRGVIASVRLPDGSVTSITTTEGEVAATVGETACVEKRVFVDSGEPRYRFKLPRHCDGAT